MGRQADDLRGKRYGKLVVISRSENNKENKAMWLCRCDCGNEKIVAAAVLKRGDTISCGCMRGIRGDSPQKPGYLRRSHKNKLYNVWSSMRNRCYTPSTSSYSYYGERGICVCAEWKNSFERFAEWSLKHGYSEGMEIDRIDTDADYSEDNCRWISHKCNSRNRRSRIVGGYPGVTFRASRTGVGGSWRASICVNAITYRLGSFTTEKDAIKARQEAEKEYWGGDAAP